jgi:uncharacterized membrane protein YkoI
MRTSWLIAIAVGLTLLAGAAFVADDDDNDEQEQKVSLDQVPKPVTDAAKAKFPQAELKGAESFKDDGATVYEVELKQAGKSIDVICKADGTILEIEKEVALADLPAPVTQGINSKYPSAKINEAEEVTELADDDEDDEEEAGDDDKDGDREEDGDDDENEDEDEDDQLVYEVEITTADGKQLEVEVTPAGKVLEVEADDDSENEADDDK